MYQFTARFRKQAENCNWGNADELIRDQVIDKYRLSEIRQTLLIKETDLTIVRLKKFLVPLRPYIFSCNEQVNRVYQKETADQYKSRKGKSKCYRCDMEGHFSRDRCCPARTVECQKRYKIGHFAAVYQKCIKPEKPLSPGVKLICDSTSRADSDNDECAFTLDSGNIGVIVTVRLEGVPVDALIDSCASTNVEDMGRAQIPENQMLFPEMLSEVVYSH